MRWGTRLRRAMLVLLACCAAPVFAGPWVEPGDPRVRADVELLRSNGIVVGPTNMWPISVAQLDSAVQRAEGLALPPGLLSAVRRLRAIVDYEHQRNRFRAELAATNQPALVRGFQESSRGIVEMSTGAQHDRGRFTVGWGVSYTGFGNPPPYYEKGNGVRFEPAFAAMRFGNWALWGGRVDRHWGPSTEGGLQVSTSARPYTQFGLRTLEPKRLEVPLLRLLGPVSFDMSGGVAREDRDDFNDPGVINLRLDFEPVKGLTVGLTRSLMLCGETRPCSAGTIAKALIGFGDFDNTGTADEPGNQIAGWDFSYNFRLGRSGQGGRVFFETAAEDEDDFLIQQYARRGGGYLFGPLGQAGSTYSVGFEYVDTLASDLMGSTKYPGSMYNNFIYTDGHTFQRRPLGFSLDGDTRMWSLLGEVTDPRNRRWYASVRGIDLNVTEFPRYRISQTNEEFSVGTFGVQLPTQIGDVRFEGRYMSDRPNTPDSNKGQFQFEAAWRSQF